MAFLISEKSGIKQKFELASSKTVIGRHPECEVVVEDSSVSRRHAQIVIDAEGQFLLEDLKSRNGTTLNRRNVHGPTKLFDGDLIEICEENFVFHSETAERQNRSRPTTEKSVSSSRFGSRLFNEMSSVSMEDDESLSSIMHKMDLQSNASSILVSSEKKLEALMNITRALNASIDLEEILAKVLDCLFELFVNSDRGFLIFTDDDGNPQPIAMKIRNENDDEKIRVSRTIVRHVMTTKQALISSDAAQDERFDLSQSITDFRIRSIMCAPLLDSDDNPIGVIQLDTLRRSVAFSDEDLELLVTVAIQAGMAIDNARKHELAHERRELQRDLELAHEVQSRLLPAKRPKFDKFDFYDFYQPANSVGGDYFDYIQLSPDRCAVIVADVVGHGIAAALLMAKLSAEVRFALAKCDTASQAVQELNRAIEDLNLDRFVTMVLGLLDFKDNKLTVVNAGHMQPLILRSDGQVFVPDEKLSDVPIGILQNAAFPEYTLEIGAGDNVLMFTDGVNESMDHDGNQYGINRMIEVMKQAPEKSPKSITESIITDVNQHIGDQSPFDDICMVAFGRTN